MCDDIALRRPVVDPSARSIARQSLGAPSGASDVARPLGDEAELVGLTGLAPRQVCIASWAETLVGDAECVAELRNELVLDLQV